MGRTWAGISLMMAGIVLLGLPSSPLALQSETGTLRFVANGEDFVRQGFVSKDGWSVNFEQVYVSLAEVTAYQADPPYDPDAGGPIQADVAVELSETYVPDLAEGGPDAAPIRIDEREAPTGHYDALSWTMPRAANGPAEGYALVLDGSATKDGRTVPFRIGIERTYGYRCGEYIGDERKGFVQAGQTAEVELTFHFDHIFGDIETPSHHNLNESALGFEPFARIAGDDPLDVDLADLEDQLTTEAYQALVDVLPTLGHVGEGHCHSEIGLD